MLLLVIFQSKSKSFHLLVVVFLYSGRLGVIYDSQATNRSAGGGGSHRYTSLLPISRLGVIYDSQPHCYTLFYSHPDQG